jgi:hypothetical protein
MADHHRTAGYAAYAATAGEQPLGHPAQDEHSSQTDSMRDAVGAVAGHIAVRLALALGFLLI